VTVLALLLALLTPAAPAEDITWYPPREVGPLTLRLGVSLEPRGPGPGRGRTP